MSKKNIDNLFQEKFRDFEEVPDEKVWNAIAASLDKKKKKRVFPIWWTLGGAAAAAIIVLIMFYPFTQNTSTSNIITDVEKVDGGPESKGKNTNEFILNNDEQVVAGESNLKPIKKGASEIFVDKKSNSNTETKKLNERLEASRKDNGHTNGLKPDLDTQLVQTRKKEDAVHTQTYSRASNKIKSTSINQIDSEIASRSNTSDSNNDNLSSKSAPLLTTSIAKHGNESNIKNSNVDEGINENSISKTEVAENLIIPEEEQKEAQETEKKSIFDEIKAEEKIVDVEKSGRWSAGPTIAPVYYNGLGEGSPINSIFNENSKSGNTNLSYGLSVAYAINNKLSIRSGVNKVDYGYDTNGVGFSSTLQEASTEKLTNIDYAGTAKNIVVTGQNSNFNSLSTSSDAMFAFEVSNNSSSPERNGTMAQQFGYLEVPLELDYALIDGKFGVNILGGISSLFLIDNSVTLTSGELITEIGEANNVNSVNFSTNIGFGVNYKFTPKIRFNVEPVFKYQLNTFSDVSGDFRPFSIGVYSGLNFKF